MISGMLRHFMKKEFTILLTVAGVLGAIASGAAETQTSPSSPPPAATVPAAAAPAATAVTAATAATAAAPATGVPKIEFGTTTFAFCKVKSGELGRHALVFTNTGTATLEIKDVKPSCGCTTAGTWEKLIEPGKTGTIPLQFNSTAFGG